MRVRVRVRVSVREGPALGLAWRDLKHIIRRPHAHIDPPIARAGRAWRYVVAHAQEEAARQLLEGRTCSVGARRLQHEPRKLHHAWGRVGPRGAGLRSTRVGRKRVEVSDGAPAGSDKVAHVRKRSTLLPSVGRLGDLCKPHIAIGELPPQPLVGTRAPLVVGEGSRERLGQSARFFLRRQDLSLVLSSSSAHLLHLHVASRRLLHELLDLPPAALEVVLCHTRPLGGFRESAIPALKLALNLLIDRQRARKLVIQPPLLIRCRL